MRRSASAWLAIRSAKHCRVITLNSFFSKMIWPPTGLRQAFVLSFLHVGTRRVFCSPCSFAPGGKWMVGQAHAAIEQAREAGLEMSYLIRDRDGMYVKEFDQVFKDAQCRVIRTAPQAPNQQAFIERWVRSIKSECLRHFIVFGKKHFDFLVSRYLSFYNTARPHQGVGIGNRPLTGSWPEVDDPLTPGEQIVCTEELGGVLRRYERRAA
ncbi:MAG: integrase core domain-containing protein [Pirellulales bacterium]|nr:integrase core domain-containing protein [Pirellulales bacterium]